MKLRIILSLSIFVAALCVATTAFATSEARVNPPDWGSERLLSYAIYRPAVGRIATAYYRLIQKEYEGRPTYEIRYNGTSGTLSEASTCIVDAVTLEPYRVTRKIKTQTDVFYIDTYYGDGRIVVRRKQGDDSSVNETSQDFPGRIFDYEYLMWLIPQLDFSNDDRLHFALFSTVGDQTILVVVRNQGEDTFVFHDKEHTATLYAFTLNMVQQNIWVQEIDGLPTVVKYDTGETILYNLSLLKGEKPATPEIAPEEPVIEEEPIAEEEVEEAPAEEAGEEEEEPPVLYDDEGNPYIPF